MSASQWYLHFLLISGGFRAFTISSGLVLDIFFYRLRQLPIAKYSYAEPIPPFLFLNCCARLVPIRWERVTGRKMLSIIPALRSVLAHAYYSPNYAGILCASLVLWVDQRAPPPPTWTMVPILSLKVDYIHHSPDSYSTISSHFLRGNKPWPGWFCGAQCFASCMPAIMSLKTWAWVYTCRSTAMMLFLCTYIVHTCS